MNHEPSPPTPKSFWRGWGLLVVAGLVLGAVAASAWGFYQSLDRHDAPDIHIERVNSEQPPAYPVVNHTIEDLLGLPERLRMILVHAFEQAERHGSWTITVESRDEDRIYKLFGYGKAGDPWTLVRFEGVLYSYRDVQTTPYKDV